MRPVPPGRPRAGWPDQRRPEPGGDRLSPGRPRDRAGRASRAGRAALALMSVVVLLVAGYAWTVYRHLDGGLVTSDVLTGPRSADGATDILLVGLDSRTDAQGNPLPRDVLDALNAGDSDGESNTDTMIVLRVPDDSSRPTTAMSIPRDSYTEIPGFGKHKINSAYPRAAADARRELTAQGVVEPELTRQADLAGRRLLTRTIEQLTGASIDHYAEVNLAGFAEITSAVGGVPVCLTAPVDDPYSGAHFAAGPQRLQGAPALAFVRQRHGLPRGDLDRVVRQQAFLASLAHQMLSAGTLADPVALTGLLDTVSRYVVIDQGWDLLAFAAQARGLTGGNIQFRTMPTGRSDLSTPSDGDAVQVDPALVRAFVAGLSTPAPEPADTADTEPSDPDRADTGPIDTEPVDPGNAVPDPAAAPTPSTATVIVDVRNGTGRSGLAAGVQDVLDDDGLVPGSLGNTSATRESVVRAADDATARRVAAVLGGLPVETDPTLADGSVTVILGSDYTGPTGPGSSAPGADDPGTGGPGTSGTGATIPGDDAAGAPPAPPVITADGVPCVS
ncbi:MAG: LCP family protein [Pseudonocardia sp.]|nr:LCP family protein [Pseudonocardia sp.]